MLVYALAQAEESYALKNFEMPVNQLDSPATALAELPLNTPFESLKDYEDYLSRLRQIPRVLNETIKVLRAGQRDGLMPPKFLLEKIPAECAGVVRDNPYLLPTKRFPESVTAHDQQRLTHDISQVIRDEVSPAYRQFAHFISREYAPHGRSGIAVESLPDGKSRYAFAIRQNTSTSLTSAQIHAIGLEQVKQINEEMTALAQKQGYEDLSSWRVAIAADPNWRPRNAEQILEDYRRYIAGMESRLPQLFGILPKTPVRVEPMPDFQPDESTHYVPGAADGSRPGRVVVAVSNPTARQMIDDEATAYHEGVPGHHMQISLAQSQPGLPEFRTRTLLFEPFSNAYAEGWALYAEQLGKDIGFYQNPVSDYGRLYSDLFRAVRLVVDTGLHDEGWTRKQAIDYMEAADINETLATEDVDRYIVWPGQALGYKLGQLQILKLRDTAKAKLGANFKLSSFHDAVLRTGPVPLDMLEAQINQWTEETLANQVAQ